MITATPINRNQHGWSDSDIGYEKDTIYHLAVAACAWTFEWLGLAISVVSAPYNQLLPNRMDYQRQNIPLVLLSVFDVVSSSCGSLIKVL